MAIDDLTKYEIISDIQRIEQLIGSGIFEQKNQENLFVKSALIEMLVCLNTLMSKSETYSSRISFTDDVNITVDVKDVSGLIRYVRAALYHSDSPKHIIPNNTLATYNIIYGKAYFMKIGEIEIKADYEDDVCFFFGKQRIYLERHIKRAFGEAKKNLLPLIG